MLKGSVNQSSREIPVASGSLSDNQLNGEMLEELGDLPNLQSLDLSGNHLGGDVPGNWAVSPTCYRWVWLLQSHSSTSLPQLSKPKCPRRANTSNLGPGKCVLMYSYKTSGFWLWRLEGSEKRVFDCPIAFFGVTNFPRYPKRQCSVVIWKGPNGQTPLPLSHVRIV